MAEGEGPKALREFLAEAQEVVEQLSRDLIKLDEQIKRGKDDPSLVNVIFRGAHSLKGISGNELPLADAFKYLPAAALKAKVAGRRSRKAEPN